MKTLSTLFSFLSLGITCVLYSRFQPTRWYVSPVFYGTKLLAGAFAPVLTVLGLIGASQGLLSRNPLNIIGGGIGAALAARFVRRVTAPHNGFDRAFGNGWRTKIPPGQVAHMRQRRWTWRPNTAPQNASVEKDVAFWTIPETDRQLLCDVWQPPPGVTPSGLALIYLHGGAWQSFDKDTFTRPLFRHLAGQGHAIMDVAYRLCPETDMRGIVGDVKRAIAWIKASAGQYGIDPDRIVVAGGSAGGHLALLAAYTPNHADLDPPDTQNADTSVRAVISFYGLPDLRRRGLEESNPSANPLTQVGARLGFLPSKEYIEPPELAKKLFGGLPQEVPDVAALMSPITHVGPACPPTLLLQGAHDHITSVDDVQTLYGALWAAGASVVYVELPQVDHAFDLFAPQFSPPAQAALYDVERFLALNLL